MQPITTEKSPIDASVFGVDNVIHTCIRIRSIWGGLYFGVHVLWGRPLGHGRNFIANATEGIFLRFQIDGKIFLRFQVDGRECVLPSNTRFPCLEILKHVWMPSLLSVPLIGGPALTT